MKNKELFQRLMAVVLCSTLLTTPIMTYATTNTTKISSEIATQAEADENGFVIENGVLVKCTNNVSEITIPNGVTTIGKQAFIECDNLEKAVIPNGVTTIEDEAFRDCGGMTSIVIPESVTSIGENVFVIVIGSDDTGEDVYLSYDVILSVVENSYAHQYALDNGIRFEFQEQSNEDENEEENESDFVIENGRLIKYNGDATELVIPSNVTSIDPLVFSKDGKFDSITIPGTVKCIESGTFGRSVHVGKLILEEGVETIEDMGFVSISNMIIPSSVTSIGKINFVASTLIGGAKRYGADIYVTKGSYAETYLNSTPVGANILSVYENGCVTIKVGSSKVNTLIEYQGTSEKVTIPEDVEVIWGGFRAYNNTNFVSEVCLPEKLTAIRSGAFADTVWMENLRKQNSVVIVDNWLLDARTATGEVIIPENVTQIADGAFYQNEEVTKVVIPNGVTKIGYEMFTGCSSLKEVVIPVSVTIVESDGGLDFSDSFDDCESLTTIQYTGTKAQWNIIDWECSYPSVTVNCTDGSLVYDAEGNVTEDTSTQDTLEFAWENSWKVKMEFPKGYESAQFSVNVYNKEGSSIKFRFGNFTLEDADADGYVYLDMSDVITESGEYYAKITVSPQGGETIIGETSLQEYIAPSEQLPIPANFAFSEDGILSFELVEGAVLYKVKVDGDVAQLDLWEGVETFTNADSKDGKTITWDIEKCIEDCKSAMEKGYYDRDINFTVTIQVFSGDINTIRHSEISEGIVYEYVYFKSEDIVLNDFNEALEDEDVEYAITLLQKVDNEMLIELLQTDADFAKKVAELEKNYQNEHTITVTSKSEVEAVDASKVSIVGAVLNAPIYFRPSVVELSIKTPVNAVEVPSKYSNELLLDITLLIDEEAQESLSVPVTITMPIPSGVSKEKLVILHYHTNATEPTVLTPVVNADNTMTFIVDGFSTFVVANDTSEDTGSSDNNGDDNSDNTGSSDNNGNDNSDNTGSSDNNGNDNSDNTGSSDNNGDDNFDNIGSSDNNENNSTNTKPSPDTGDSSAIFMYIALGMIGALLITYKKIRKA